MNDDERIRTAGPGGTEGCGATERVLDGRWAWPATGRGRGVVAVMTVVVIVALLGIGFLGVMAMSMLDRAADAVLDGVFGGIGSLVRRVTGGAELDGESYFFPLGAHPGFDGVKKAVVGAVNAIDVSNDPDDAARHPGKTVLLGEDADGKVLFAHLGGDGMTLWAAVFLAQVTRGGGGGEQVGALVSQVEVARGQRGLNGEPSWHQLVAEIAEALQRFDSDVSAQKVDMS